MYCLFLAQKSKVTGTISKTEDTFRGRVSHGSADWLYALWERKPRVVFKMLKAQLELRSITKPFWRKKGFQIKVLHLDPNSQVEGPPQQCNELKGLHRKWLQTVSIWGVAHGKIENESTDAVAIHLGDQNSTKSLGSVRMWQHVCDDFLLRRDTLWQLHSLHRPHFYADWIHHILDVTQT